VLAQVVVGMVAPVETVVLEVLGALAWVVLEAVAPALVELVLVWVVLGLAQEVGSSCCRTGRSWDRGGMERT